MKAVYAGSFDPFTNGHLDIVCEASKMFETLYVVIANNSSKKRYYDLLKMSHAIELTVKRLGLDNVVVEIDNGLIIDYCHSVGATYLIRGLRNPSDYVYEENLALINRELDPKIRTLYIRAEKECLSSSMVREFIKYGRDVEAYLPPEVCQKFSLNKN